MKKKCSCGNMIRFLKNSNNKAIPVVEVHLHADEVSALDAGMEVLFDTDRHINHFAECPDAKKHRKSNGK